MPKNPVLESAKHHLLSACRRYESENAVHQDPRWKGLLETLDVADSGEQLVISWRGTTAASLQVDRSKFQFYQRGDRAEDTAQAVDPHDANQKTAEEIIRLAAQQLGLQHSSGNAALLEREQSFHDKWAFSTTADEVQVIESFEACTAPENRWIMEMLGDVKGKTILDLGCGLGEAGVYFATRGAKVTCSDLSPGMLTMATQVAKRFNVEIKTHQSSADHTGIPDASFDIVYAANILHHSDIPKVLDEARRILKPGGIFVSWDPLIHNPAINIYRQMAMAVRTIDEHPLHIQDIQLFQARFKEVKWRCFWLSTLLIFAKFYFWDRAKPSEERYWKKILTEAKSLESLHQPLARLDRIILRLFPVLNRYCWNIVFWCRR